MKEPLRGTLINVVTTHPSFAPARPLLKLLGIAETGEYTGDSLESWKEFVRLSEYMYEDIINNMTEAAIKDSVGSQPGRFAGVSDWQHLKLGPEPERLQEPMV